MKFYLAHLDAQNESSILPNAFLSAMKGMLSESDNRISRLLFKLAVELAMTMNVAAASCNINRESLSRLRGECVQEVKRLNGAFSFEDAYRWQKE